MKLCSDCVYFVPDDIDTQDPTFHECMHPSLERSRVTGKLIFVRATLERREGAMYGRITCGPNARYFAPRKTPSTKEHKGWPEKLLDWLIKG